MKLNTAIAIAVAAAFAVPFAAQASAEADRIILAQTSGKITTDPKDSNPAAPPATTGTPRSADTTSDRPASGAAAGSSTAPSTSTTAPAGATTGAPVTSGSNAADRAPNTPKAEAGATSGGGFSTMDKNNDGYISRDEAKDATWSNRFTELDKDNDGRLSQSEFNAIQAGAGIGATGTTGSGGAPLTSGTNAPDRKPSTPKQ
jgi:hypothetical protein